MALFGIFGNSENLYFPGCYSSSFLGKKAEQYRKILKKLKIDFKMQKPSDFRCCGGFLDEAGYEKQLRKTARDNHEYFSKKGYKKIITNCPLCYNTFKNYKELLPNWTIESEHILITILNKLKETMDVPRNYFSEPVVYYDSCYLARYAGITEQPRELLNLLGYKVIDLTKNREETLCCGSCGNLPATNHELSIDIAKDFLRMLKRRGIKKVVTADLRDYQHLSTALLSMNIPDSEVNLVEISDLICDSLNIRKE